MIVLAAVVASGLGAVARFSVAGAVQRRFGGRAVLGTAAVNVLGAVALGVLAGLHRDGRLTGDALAIVGTGFLGGFTTFSTWMVEAVQLGEDGTVRGSAAAAVNLIGMLVAGVGGVAVATWVT